jgi:hypothetical protein
VATRIKLSLNKRPKNGGFAHFLSQEFARDFDISATSPIYYAWKYIDDNQKSKIDRANF